MGKDLTIDKPIKLIMYLAIPILIGLIGQQLYIIVDTMIVSKICGEQGVAVISSVSALTNITQVFYTASAMAVGIIIAQLCGAKEKIKLRKAITTSMITAIVLGLLMTTIGVLNAEFLMKAVSIPDSIYMDAKIYLIVIFLGLTFKIGFGINDSICVAMGDSKADLIFLVVGNIINVFLDVIFMMVMKLGVASSAVAIVLSNLAMVIMSYIRLISKFKSLKVSVIIKEGFFEFSIFISIFKLMLPATILIGLWAISTALMQVVVNNFGIEVVTAHGIVGKIETLSVIFTAAIYQAMLSFTGQNIGARKIGRIKRAYKDSNKIGIIVTLGIEVFVYVFAKDIILFLTGGNISSATLNLAFVYLRICVPFYFLYSIYYCSQGVLRGSSDMKGAMVGILAMYLTRVIAVYLLADTFKVTALFVSVPIGLISGAVYGYIIYSIEKWKNKVIVQREDDGSDLELEMAYEEK